MIKILIIPAFRLYPIDSGGAHGQLAFLEKLQHKMETDILITPDNIDEAYKKEFSNKFPGLNCIYAGYQKPTTGKKLKTFFHKVIAKISGKDHAYQLRKYGLLNGVIQTKPALLEEIKRLISKKKYDIIQAEHSVNIGLIEILPQGPKKVFVHHEIAHTRVCSDMKAMGYSAAFSDYFSGAVRELEKGWLKQYDGVITFCREDAELLMELGVTVPVQTAQPFALFDDELQNVYNASLPPQLLFVGGEAHYPNNEGLSWFLAEVYPGIKQQYIDCSISITGNWSAAFREKFSTDNSIKFTGFLPTLDGVYQNSILVVPVRIGSGIRVKVFTALAKGVPVIGTALGLSGIPGLKNNLNAVVVDEAVEFTEKVVELLKDEGLRQRISAQGFLLASSSLHSTNFAEERITFYKQILNKVDF